MIVLGAFVDVSVGKEASSFPYTNNNKSAQHFPTLKIDFYFLYTECGGLVCRARDTPNTNQEQLHK